MYKILKHPLLFFFIVEYVTENMFFTEYVSDNNLLKRSKGRKPVPWGNKCIMTKLLPTVGCCRKEGVNIFMAYTIHFSVICRDSWPTDEFLMIIGWNNCLYRNLTLLDSSKNTWKDLILYDVITQISWIQIFARYLLCFND